MKVLLIWLSITCSAVAYSEPNVTISAAISLKDAFQELSQDFKKRHPGFNIHLNFASSGHLRQQIEAGAPVDIFASASQAHMDLLEKKKLIRTEERVNIAHNQLVLTTTKSSPLTPVNFEQINRIPFKRISIGQPSSVPAGKYAKEALLNAGQWSGLKERVIFADHVRQVFSYVDRGEVDLGIIYYTDYILNKGHLKAIAFVPDALHSPISYPMALVSHSKNRDFYLKWKIFLLGKSGQEILKKYGFK